MIHFSSFPNLQWCGQNIYYSLPCLFSPEIYGNIWPIFTHWDGLISTVPSNQWNFSISGVLSPVKVWLTILMFPGSWVLLWQYTYLQYTSKFPLKNVVNTRVVFVVLLACFLKYLAWLSQFLVLLGWTEHSDLSIMVLFGV